MGKLPNAPTGAAKFCVETGLHPQRIATEELEKRAAELRRCVSGFCVSPSNQEWFAQHVSTRIRFMDANNAQCRAWLRGSNGDRSSAEEKFRKWASSWADDFLDDTVDYKRNHSESDGVPLPLPAA